MTRFFILGSAVNEEKHDLTKRRLFSKCSVNMDYVRVKFSSVVGKFRISFSAFPFTLILK